jgi:hypothetical protein
LDASSCVDTDKVDAAAGDAGVMDDVYASRTMSFGAGRFAGDPVACPAIAPCRKPAGATAMPATTECANSAGNSLDQVRGSYDILGRFNDLVRRGENTALIRIQGYSKQADDPDVIVSFYTGDEIDSCDREGRPRWDGRDSWGVDEESVVSGGVARASALGQVVNRRVAVTIPTLPLRADTDFSLVLSNARLYIEFDANGDAQDALLTGRWNAYEGYRALRNVQTGNPERPICADPTVDQFARTFICAARDTSSQGTADGGAATCNAASMTLYLSLGRARLGKAVKNPGVPLVCEEGGLPPACPP